MVGWMEVKAPVVEQLRASVQQSQHRGHVLDVVLDVHGEAAQGAILQAMRAVLGLGQDEREDAHRFCGLFGLRVEGVAAGVCGGRRREGV